MLGLGSSSGGGHDLDRDLFPLSWAQERAWSAYQLGGTGGSGWLLRLEGDLEAERLTEALEGLVHRREILRTRFLEVSGSLRQEVQRPWRPGLPVVDLSGLDPDRRRSRGETIGRWHRSRRRRLNRLPLADFLLLRLEPQEHFLSVAFPALLFDAASRDLFLEELASAYEEPVRDSPEAPGLQAGDLAVRQRFGLGRKGKGSPGRRSQAPPPPTVPLPLDRRGRPRSSGCHRVPLGPLTGPPSVLRRPGGDTTCRAWAAMLCGLALARWTGGEAVALSVAYDLRPSLEAEGALGCWTEPLRASWRLPRGATVGALYWQVADVLEAEATTLARSAPGAEPRALLRVSPPARAFRGRFLDLSSAGEPEDSGDLGPAGLFLALRTDGRRLTGFLEMDAALFDASTALRLARRLKGLAAAISSLNLPAHDLPGTTAGERHQLLHEWSGPAAPAPEDGPLHRKFEAWAERTPGAPAVRWPGGGLSYQELDVLAAAVARWLRTLGVEEGDRVGICVEAVPALAVGMLACLKAGAAYLLLDCRDPQDRTARILRRVGLAAMVSEDSVTPNLPPPALPTVCIDLQRPPLGGGRYSAAGSAERPAVLTLGPLDEDGPELAVFSHRAVAAWARSAASLGGPAREGILLASNPASEVATVTAWTAWAAGGWWAGTPEVETAVLHLAVEALPPAGGAGTSAGGEAVIFGAVPVAGAGAALGGAPKDGRPAVLVYGCAGGPPVVAAGPAGGPGAAPVAVGSRVYLLDRGFRPVGIGGRGSLWVGGEGLPSELLGRPAATAARLRPDPFSGTPGTPAGARLLATGDRARLSPTGTFTLAGREDRQVAVAGHRVEPAEVEALLAAHPEVQSCRVERQEDPAAPAGLVAHVVKGSPLVGPDGGWPREEPHAQGEERGASHRSARETLAVTAERILAAGPRRILEVGTADGGLALHLAPVCQRYTVKARPGSLKPLERSLGEDPSVGSLVEVLERPLEDFRSLEGRFDLVILGPWVRRLPSVEMLLRLLDGAARTVAPAGFVFLAGLSNERLRPLRLLDGILQEAPGEPPEEIARRLDAAFDDDGELSLAPAFFGALRHRSPWLEEARLWPRPSLGGPGAHGENEERYLFDARLRVGEGSQNGGAPEVAWRDWNGWALDLDGIRRHLRRQQPELFGLSGVPNGPLRPRLERMAEVLQAAGRTDDGVPPPVPGLDPDDLWRLQAELPYRVEVSWARSGRLGTFDVLFQRRGAAELAGPELPGPEERTDPPEVFAREPLRGRVAERFRQRLRSFLAAKLPAYLMPTTFHVVSSLPPAGNGKVGAGEAAGAEGASPAAELSPTAAIVADLWRELVAEVEPGAEEDPAPASPALLAGSTTEPLLGSRLAQGLARIFRIELDPQEVLEAGTVAATAELVDRRIEEKIEAMAAGDAWVASSAPLPADDR